MKGLHSTDAPFRPFLCILLSMLSLRAGALSAVIGCAMMLPFFAHAQNAYPGESLPCANAHLATTQEAASASPKGSIVAGVTYVCPGDARLGISDDAGAAKTYLRSIICVPPDRDNYGGVGPDETIRGLDAKFAVCAAGFLKSVNATGRPYCISEGKRSVEKQNEYASRPIVACKKGALCEHPRGIAIDIKVQSMPGAPCSEFTRAHQLAPQFGLTFYLGCKDAYHFVPQKAGCSAGGTAPSAGSFPTGGTNLNPNSFLPASFYDNPQYAPSAATSPFSSALNALTPLLNNPTQPTTPTTPSYTQPTSNPSNYQGIPLPSASSSIFEISPPYTFPTGTTTSSTNTSQTTSYYDKLALLAGSTQTGASAPTGGQNGASSTILNGDLYDIDYGNKERANIDDVQIPVIATNSVAINSIHVTETFTQPTAVQSAPSGAQAAKNQTLIVALLTTLRDLLVSYLKFLKSQPTYGFEGSWQLKQPTATYR
jgi:hypothetical protein